MVIIRQYKQESDQSLGGFFDICKGTKFINIKETIYQSQNLEEVTYKNNYYAN